LLAEAVPSETELWLEETLELKILEVLNKARNKAGSSTMEWFIPIDR